MVLNRWCNYFEEIPKVECARSTISSASPEYDSVQKITVVETEAAIKKTKPGKAMGPDDSAAYLWKSKSWYPAEWLTTFFNQVVAENGELAEKHDDSNLEEGGQSNGLHKLPSNSFVFAYCDDL